MDITSSVEEESKPCLTYDKNGIIVNSQDSEFSDVIQSNGIYKSTTVPEGSQTSSLPQIFASVSAASFHIVVGFSLAYSAILLPQIETEDGAIQVTKTQSAFLASSLVLVVPIGALLAGVAMEYFGRLNTIKLATIPCTIGWVLMATGNSFAMLLFARLLTGVAAGLGTSPAIVYITEVAKPEYRGSLISACPTLASLGMVIAYAEGAYFHWRIVAWTSIIYIIIPLVLIILFIPESPVWLVARGRVEDADSSLRWLSGDKSILPLQQLAAMVKSQDMKALLKRSFCTRLTGFLRPTGYKPLIILTVLFFFQQFSGIYITLFYAVIFFQDAGSGIDPSIATIMVGVVRLVMSLFNTALMRRFGRRPLCVISGLAMAICMTISGCFTQYILNGGEHYSWVPVMCILLYVCSSMIGLLSIPWTMTAELFPTDIRGIAHGIVVSIAHIIMFLAVQSYRDLTSILGGAHGLQWFFAVMSIGGSIFVWVCLPETHGKSLSDIERYFKENTIFIFQKKKLSLHIENGDASELANINSK